jgi:phosphohistidine phosphatase
MRHGEAEGAAPGGDAMRALTPRGRDIVEGAARALKRMGLRPEALWHSPYVRARQTAEIVAETLGLDGMQEKEGLVPHGSAAAMAEALFEAKARSIFVVAHLPILPALCVELLDAPARLSIDTASVVHMPLLGGSSPRGAAVLSGMWPGATLASLQ